MGRWLAAWVGALVLSLGPSAQADEKGDRDRQIAENAGVIGALSPVASIQKLTTRGGRSKDRVRSRISALLPKIGSCAKGAEIRGRMSASFSILPNGTTVGVTVQGKPESYRQCAKTKLQALRLKAARGTTSVEVELGQFSGAFGALTGSAKLEGGWGYGLSGTGKGGGGGGIGIGTIGHGSGSGSGSGYGYGRGKGRLGGGRASAKLGKATVAGSLDKNIIRRFVRRHIGRVRYCYEKELVKRPKLRGTAVTSFTIGADGRVSRARVSGLNRNARTCIKNAILSIRFPKPRTSASGKSTVKVRYPFTFSPPTRIGIGKRGGLRSKIGRIPKVHAGNATVGPGGNLDKNIIRRVIRRNIAKVRNCYERALLREPKLAGRVTTRFQIGADGSVISVTASGIQNAAVEQCVEGVVRAMLFPKPKGGGIVTVSYPFLFKPAP